MIWSKLWRVFQNWWIKRNSLRSTRPFWRVWRVYDDDWSRYYGQIERSWPSYILWVWAQFDSRTECGYEGPVFSYYREGYNWRQDPICNHLLITDWEGVYVSRKRILWIAIPEYEKALRTFVLTQPEDVRQKIENEWIASFNYIKQYLSGKSMNSNDKQSMRISIEIECCRWHWFVKEGQFHPQIRSKCSEGSHGRGREMYDRQCHGRIAHWKVCCWVVDDRNRHSSLTENYLFIDPKTNKQYEIKAVWVW